MSTPIFDDLTAARLVESVDWDAARVAAEQDER